jgi:hypothetical protein
MMAIARIPVLLDGRPYAHFPPKGGVPRPRTLCPLYVDSSRPKCANTGHSSPARRTAQVDPKRPSTDSRGSFSSSLLFHVDISGFGPVFVLGSVATEVRHERDQGKSRRSWLRTSLATAGWPVVTAYTLDWANEVPLLGEFPNLRAYLERMYTRPNAPPRIAQALASITA